MNNVIVLGINVKYDQDFLSIILWVYYLYVLKSIVLLLFTFLNPLFIILLCCKIYEPTLYNIKNVVKLSKTIFVKLGTTIFIIKLLLISMKHADFIVLWCSQQFMRYVKNLNNVYIKKWVVPCEYVYGLFGYIFLFILLLFMLF